LISAVVLVCSTFSAASIAAIETDSSRDLEFQRAGGSQYQADGLRVSATGYGSSPLNEAYSVGQKKLMARRASKLDAFRALAEEVQGVRVNGNTTVSAMVAQIDGFRVFVEAYVRGAQVVSVVALPDGNYETTLELTLDKSFLDNYSKRQVALPSNSNVALVGSAESESANSNAAMKGSTAADYGRNFYFSE